MMTLLAPLFSAALAAPLLVSAPGGSLDTLPRGTYVCSYPGDAGGPAWTVVPDREFSIGNGSSYRTKDGAGTYLYAGKTVRFTRGPMKGLMFERTADVTLREVGARGERGRLRCIRRSGSR